MDDASRKKRPWALPLLTRVGHWCAMALLGIVVVLCTMGWLIALWLAQWVGSH